MLKRVLLLVDETPASRIATDLALALARRCDAALTGIGGIDVPFVEQPQLVPMGGLSWKRQMVEADLAKARERRGRLQAAFKTATDAAGVAAAWHDFEGEPSAFVLGAAETHDIIVMGRDSTFHGDGQAGLGDVPAFLLRRTPRPLLIAPDPPARGSGVMIAYDGSLPVMRTLQLAVLLGLAINAPAVVLSVADEASVAQDRCTRAVDYLKAHGLVGESRAVASREHPAGIIRAEIESRRPALLVMGAFGHRGLREVLFGSTTQRLVEAPPCPLFVYQ